MKMKRITGDFYRLCYLNLTNFIPDAVDTASGYGKGAGVMVFSRTGNLTEESARTILLELADELGTRHGMRSGALAEKIREAFDDPDRESALITRNSDGSYNEEPQIQYLPRRSGYVEISAESYDDREWFTTYFDGVSRYSWSSRMLQTRFILKEV